MDISNIVQLVTIAIVPFLLAIVVHEVAHGLVARHYGDNTAFMLGRLTLNPVKHIDPVGTVIFPLLQLVHSGTVWLGWAKPVPVNTRNLRNPKKSMTRVALAGPLSNLLMAFLWALLYALVIKTASVGVQQEGVIRMAMFGISFNVLLAVFNMLPLPPLDGGRVALGALPYAQSRALARIEPYGMVILMVLLLSGVLSPVIGPVINGITRVILTLVGV